MAKRKENMLEAFQASGDGSGGIESARSPLEVAGPFAPAPLAEPRPARTRERRVAPPEQDLALAPVAMPFGSVTFLVIQILLLAGAFALGRLTAPPRAVAGTTSPDDAASTAVEEPSAEPDLLSASTASAAELADEPAADIDQLTDHDRAFRDPANKFTIQVVQYRQPEREWSRTLAYATYDHLHARGLPVVKPIAQGNNLFVYVGAAPTKAALAQTLAIVQKTPGPGDSANAFQSAYIVDIPTLR